MSDAPAGADDAAEALRDAYDRLRHRYEFPALIVVIAFMLWVRLQAMSNFVDAEKVYFAGNDAYYHFREINYVIRHWPFTMPFDPWSYFPYGTSQGQFGTLFDQLIATAALVVGLGSPSEQLVAKVILVAPTVFGSLVAIPSFFIGRRLAGRRAGVMAAVVLALLPGTFLHRGLVGSADHNIAEVLFQATAVFAVMVAVAVAERDQPVYELVVDRDWAALRSPVAAAVAAGVALFLYVWLWPPAVVLVGILGVFFVLAIPLHVFHGRSPEPLAAAGAVSMSALTVLQVPVMDTLAFSTTKVGPLQVLLSAGVAAGCLYMAWLARIWDSRSVDRRMYPVAIGASIFFGVGLLSVLLPTVFDILVHNLLRTFAFGQTDTTLTIAEAKSIPFNAAGEFLYQQYGLTFAVAMVGLAGLAYPAFISRSYRAEHLLVAVWALAITLMAFTQVRFNYYLAVVVAVLTAWLVEQFLRAIELPASARDLEVYQVLALAIAVLLVLAPLLPPLAAGAATCQQGSNVCHVAATGQLNGPGAVVTWTEELDWMEANTPAVGRYGGATNDLDYYGTYERTDDFAYPAGAYGVMSWWDYGHWITVEGERIPNANPFQQGPRPASAFLLTDNETRANLLLEALSAPTARGAVHELSNDELRAAIDAQTPQQAAEDTRYVMIDDQMAAGKFSAIATWTGDGPGQYFSRQEFRVRNSSASLFGPNDAYHDTMLARLYFQDASGLSHYRLVHETNQTTSIVSVARQTPNGWTSDLNGDGRPGDYMNRRLSSAVYNTVQQNPSLAFYDIRQAATVKTFERVPGATLTGQVNTTNATTVFATLRLRTNTGRNLTYIQSTTTDADGNFELTVPYATTNSVGPAEGGTDSGVVAQGEYRLFAGNPFQPSATGNASVPEPAIYDAETITVELVPTPAPPSGNETNTTNRTSVRFPDDVTAPAQLQSSGDRGGPRVSTVAAGEPRRWHQPRPALDA